MPIKRMESNQPQQQFSDITNQVENLRAGIREIAHEISNPLGIIRMAIYFLQTTNPTGETREHYFKVVQEGLERIERSLQDLKVLRENPANSIHDRPPANHA